MLDVAAKLILSGDVSPLATAANLYVAEGILSPCHSTKLMREPLPSAHVCVVSAGGNAHNEYIFQVNFGKSHGKLCCSPSRVYIPAILKTENHSADILLFKTCPTLETSWNIII